MYRREFLKMPIFVNKKEIVVPGDLLAEGEYKIGEGVFRQHDKYYATIIGIADLKGNTISVVPLRGNYIPRVNDIVIGKIVEVSLTSWRVDINAPYFATLRAAHALDRKIDIVKDSLKRYYDIGDIIIAKIISFERGEPPLLTTKENGLGKLVGGTLMPIHPTRVPRLIGRKGSMINLLKKETGCKIRIGQNGYVWFLCRRPEIEQLLIRAILKIEREAHTEGLTDRIKDFIQQEKRLIERGESK